MASRIGDFSAAERNRAPIYTALGPRLVDGARVLEIGAGDGTHARFFVARRPDLVWQASEAPAQLDVLAAGLADHNALPAPIALDVCGDWPAGVYDAVYASNVAHIMSERAVAAFFSGAARHLAANGLLALYGPFFEQIGSEQIGFDQNGLDDDRRPPGEGNLAFDRALRARDPAMGLRERAWLDTLAVDAGLSAIACEPMPADNRLLLWQRVSRSAG